MTYGPTFHQHQELLVHCESLSGELHRVHHSTLKYSVVFLCPGTISLSSVWTYLANARQDGDQKQNELFIWQKREEINTTFSTREKKVGQ